MSIVVNHINEFHSLYGGLKKRKEIGNAFQALVNYHFEEIPEKLGNQESEEKKNHLIFAIVENVNLNNPSLFGLGDTLFFTHQIEDSENQFIKEEYKSIIKAVEKQHKRTLAEYIDWYESDSVLITVSTGSTKPFDIDNSQWRTRFFANREEKGQKDKDGIIKWDEEKEGKSFKQHVEEYFQFYVGLLRTKLSFNDFPHFVVIAKPISLKNKEGIIKLGNLYLHFATTKLKENKFYHRLLNDFLLIWLREEGSGIIKQIGSDAADRAKKEDTKSLNTHLPAIWASANASQFSQSEINKLNSKLGGSHKSFKDFYDEIFIYNSMNCHSQLVDKEKQIIDTLIPILLKHKTWLKDGVTVSKENIFISYIKENVDHKVFDGFDVVNVNRFTTLLALRHIVNVCYCCFGLEIDKIHSFLSAGEIKNEDKTAIGYLGRLTGYFSKLFFFGPSGKNIISYQKQDAFDGASLKERTFMKECASKIQLLIKNEKKSEYNSIAVANFKLDSQEMKKFNTGNVSRLAVFDFKTNWCNENEIIPKLLKEKAEKYLIAPILDCGAGLGDIAYKAFPEKEAILIDVNPIEDKETTTSPLHKNVIKSIFDFYPDKPIKTLLISHTLQFIDSDIDLLNKQIDLLNPATIILVLNENNDIMGDVLKWTKDNYENANPEEKIIDFPNGYDCVEKINFQADVKCITFTQLAKQISYLMMIDLSETGDLLENFLKTKLKKPEFKFNQVIEVYQKPKS